jgi:hypothetical protein
MVKELFVVRVFRPAELAQLKLRTTKYWSVGRVSQTRRFGLLGEQSLQRSSKKNIWATLRLDPQN